jgi:hypothetical protein
MSVSKAYQDTGVLGTVEDVVSDLFSWLAAAAVLSPGIATVLVLGSELGSMSSLHFAPVQGIVGLVIYAGAYFLMGPFAIIPAVLVGSSIQTRSLTQDEIDFVNRVFQNTIPYDKIVLTNLIGIGGRPFTFPNVDGTILVNIGVSDAMYNDPTHNAWGAYSTAGELLVHELTHAWQIANSSFIPGWICDALSAQAQGSKAYLYGPAGPDYTNGFNIEAQAAIVDQWFGATRVGGSTKQMDQSDPYFRYIAYNIWLGQR